jgi:hypothetical protein
MWPAGARATQSRHYRTRWPQNGTVQFSYGFFFPKSRFLKTRKVRSRITRDACIHYQLCSAKKCFIEWRYLYTLQAEVVHSSNGWWFSTTLNDVKFQTTQHFSQRKSWEYHYKSQVDSRICRTYNVHNSVCMDVSRCSIRKAADQHTFRPIALTSVFKTLNAMWNKRESDLCSGLPLR